MGNEEPPYDFFHALNLHFQFAEYIIVIDKPVDLKRSTKWIDFVKHLWQQGYVKLLFYTSYNEKLYHKIIFPEIVIEETLVEHYIFIRGSFKNLYGYPVRVAAYNNAPRSMLYVNRCGKHVFAGFYMRFLRAFIGARNGSFVPVLTPSDSPGNCTLNLVNETVDVCADALAANPAAFSLTHGFRIASANVLVTHAKPLHSYRYLTAPFQWSVWACLVIYVLLVVNFLSFIGWLRSGKWEFSKHLLEVFSSLLFSGFYLKEIRGRERYILFGVLFIAGFVYSTEYLGLLKSMLISEVFEKQIDTFEALVESNITLMVDPYDKILFAKYNMPEILSPIMELVSFETLLEHRNSFDQDYAYILFSDRMALYDYAQQFLKHPKLLRIPIDFSFLYTGIPMRKRWFLKHHLGRAWYWAFESGLTRKLALDADFEAVRVGYLSFLITEHVEAQPLNVDYFVMPAIALAIGYILALLSFVIEMTAWRIREFLGCKKATMTSTGTGCPGGGHVDVD
ncbi:GM20411 [Drosophila sechellia]|uniref:GM20411 n=2 Tax=Drosophila sechellia TaxID=7238 RepID=B4HNS7_DROSE|nr:GM20411 [Drosophila sechellia]